ncbi:MAG: hypothetical protein EON58_02225 [Alphaproteobacteria bacterium]|nr:MAG: hypothetical protein EON58_02225 [Alphaproteobacteria bacterium]
MIFPRIPERLLTTEDSYFEAAPDVREFAYDTFISGCGPLVNDDHEHLADADVLFVWSSVEFSSKGNNVVATCQLGEQTGGLGKKEFQEWQYRNLNGGMLPDFVVTLCAPFFTEADSVAVCAVIEHELHHTEQKKDKHGVPKRNQGKPVWGIKGHDVEVFIRDVERYGAYSPSLIRLKAALDSPPLINPSEAKVAVCGCGARI